MRKMKDSGIVWAIKIPENWDVMPNKFLMRKEKAIVCKYNGENILSLTMNGVIVRNFESGGKMPLSFDGYQRIKAGNLLLCLFDIDVTPRCVGIIKNEGLTSPAYSQYVMMTKANANYYYYYYLMLDFTKELLHMAKNLRHSFSDEQFGALLTIVPPLEEQKQIADFLDKKCAEIDKLIELQESMIEKLKEYKQSVITQAVTKGLDPDVPMKDSGIEWIGKIPEGWEIIKIKDSFNLGKGLPITKADLLQNGAPVISYGQIHSKSNNGVSINDSLIRFVKEDYYKSAPYALANKGDFIFADTSEDIEGCGNCVYLDAANSLFAGYHTIVMKSKQKQSNKYFAYLFKSDIWRAQIRTKVSGIKVFSVTQRILKDIQLLLPSNIIQQQIADYLDKKCAEIDDLIKLKEQKIEKLKEYKKSLIYEYVTGKKEVC